MKSSTSLPARTLSLFFILSLSLPLIQLHAESFRGELTLSLTPSVAGEEIVSNGDFSLFELAEIVCPENPLSESIRLILDIPRSFLRYRDSFSLSLYSSYSPPAGEGIQNYSGTLLYQDMLPSFSRVSINIPLTKREQSGGAGVINVKKPLDRSIFPLVLQIVPIMKGLPAELVHSAIPISAELLLEDAGFLDLSILDPRESPIADPQSGIYQIDGEKIDPKRLMQPLKLSTGVHTLQIEVPGFAAENSTFSITRGERSRKKITLQPLLGKYRIQAPKGTLLYIDGEQIPSDDSESLKGELSPGEHMLFFRFGDYQLSRKIDIEGGKEYTIELFFDILVQEH